MPRTIWPAAPLWPPIADPELEVDAVRREYLGGFGPAADAACNTLAQAVSLPGSYKAWLSTPYADARQRLCELLTAAVEKRLIADVPLGAFLSGGIDSCAIVGLSAASTQGAVKAFTIGFDSSDYDETPIATEMAQASG